MHRETAGPAEESVDGREHEEACARIIAKLGRLKERDASEVEINEPVVAPPPPPAPAPERG